MTQRKPADGLGFWLVVMSINAALAVFQLYRDLEAGDNQSLKFKCWGGESNDSNPGPIALQAKSLTTRPPLFPPGFLKGQDSGYN